MRQGASWIFRILFRHCSVKLQTTVSDFCTVFACMHRLFFGSGNVPLYLVNITAYYKLGIQNYNMEYEYRARHLNPTLLYGFFSKNWIKALFPFFGNFRWRAGIGSWRIWRWNPPGRNTPGICHQNEFFNFCHPASYPIINKPLINSKFPFIMESENLVTIVIIDAALCTFQNERLRQYKSILNGHLRYLEVVGHENTAYIFDHCVMKKPAFVLLLTPGPVLWVLVRS